MENNYIKLKEIAFKVRKKCLKTLKKGSFLGSAFSCVEILIYLYERFLDNQNNIGFIDRDFFLLSKGHAAIMLYLVLKEVGIIEFEVEKEYLKYGTNIYYHPNCKVKGVEFHTGSLGHAFSIGVGVALDMKVNKEQRKVVVLMGDGELNEGSNWESLLIANAKKLDNLLVIIDRNQIQANAKTEDLSVLEPLKDKFESFGCSGKEIDGHDFSEIEKALSIFPFEQEKVSVLISHSIRGKGIKSIENDWEKWFFQCDDEMIQKYTIELEENYAKE